MKLWWKGREKKEEKYDSKGHLDIEEMEGLPSRGNPFLRTTFHYTGVINGAKVMHSGYAVKQSIEIGTEKEVFYVKHAEKRDVLGTTFDEGVAEDRAYELLAGEIKQLMIANPDYDFEVTEKLRRDRESKLAEFVKEFNAEVCG